ncbi:hypothetical protein [Vibrio nigripulchritudo]|uniref:hypothetical protein n=1 Tax=Vibrio nigripulchritudo TaxID=28173 RepID=UPI002493BAB4|nr:hypothetical protein [Vibrio nigripulchritudo]BDU42877.1 hypothetical protein TUMSATVNIG3_16750 [Vibrio nigripulchritudo]
MNANKVTGEEFQAARISLGLSISMVGKQLLDGNRNTLSHFEKEKGTLTLRDKKKLINFYEEYGYDFGQPDDEEVLSEHVKENIEHSIGSLEKVDDREVSAAMIELVHDVMDVLSLVKRPVVQESSPVLSAESQQLSDELVKHFEADKQGQFKDTTGFFGDSASGRGENLMGLLAYLKLQELQLNAGFTFFITAKDDGKK